MRLWAALLCAALFCAVLPVAALAQDRLTYTDKDWTAVLTDTCGLPVLHGPHQSMRWVRQDTDRKLRVTLGTGDVGRCSTDAQARHRARFWERAELSQRPVFARNSAQQIAFEMTVLEGMTGPRETFFQIHAWTSACNASPLLMLKAHRGRLTAWGLRAVRGDGTGKDRGKHRRIHDTAPRIAALYGKPLRFTVLFDARARPARVAIDLNGAPFVADAPLDYAPCAAPHVKLGLYRPSGAGAERSTVLFDDIRIQPID